MNNKPSYFILILFLFVLLFSCSRKEVVKDDDIQEKTQEEVKDTVKVQSISLGFSKVEIQVGGTYRFSPAIYPENATDKTLLWSSSDTGIVEVSDGVVRGVSVGEATITVSAAEGGATASCKVAVVSDKPEVEVPLKSISLEEESLTLKEGESHHLKVTFIPSNATDKTLSWSSDNESLLTVTDGTVQAVRAPEPDRAGPVMVTAKSRDGGFTARCSVTITCDATGIELNRTSLSLKEKNKFTLVATVVPSRATTRDIVWKSGNAAVATVSQNGEVTAVSKGSTVITASLGSLTVACKVMVEDSGQVDVVHVTGVKLNVNQHSMDVGETYTLQKTISPPNATDKSVTWKSSDADVVKVDNGILTAISTGEATITVTTNDGGYTDNCSITVAPTRYIPVTGIEIHQNGSVCYSTTMGLGELRVFEGVIIPHNATNQNFTWSRNQSAAGSITPDGKYCTVTAGSTNEGIIVLYARSEEEDKLFTCQINVKKIPLERITFDKEKVTVKKGQSVQLVVNYYPSNAVNKDLSWSFGEGTDKSVVDLSETGVVTGKKIGSCKIVAKSKVDSSIKAECTVTVENGSNTENLGFEDWN